MILIYQSNNTVSCASCHKQELAFSDTNVVSIGVNGTTVRHSMRLINTRFASETKFFWDERALNLETQTTMPIKDHGEMGFSGENGDLSFNDLITRLNGIGYYKELFKFVYGTEEITEAKIQNALAQFIRSIQSFDSKYDRGRALAANDGQPFTNFTAQENQGKNLFLTPPTFDSNSIRTSGGLGSEVVTELQSLILILIH
jgi:cytochrome c peroxidase